MIQVNAGYERKKNDYDIFDFKNHLETEKNLVK